MYQSPNEFCLYLASPNLCSESQVLDYETLIVESSVYVLYLHLFGLDTSRNWKAGKNVGALYIDGKSHVFYGQFFLHQPREYYLIRIGSTAHLPFARPYLLGPRDWFKRVDTSVLFSKVLFSVMPSQPSH